MKTIFNPKVVIAALLISLFFLCATLVYILVERPAAADPGQNSLDGGMTIISGPTSTPRPLPPTLTSIPPTPANSPTPAPGEITVGVYVQPSTEGAGLRVHSDPKLAADFFSAFDSEVFLITKGPEQADGYTWWYLTASYDTSRAGWAVQDYLKAIPNPSGQ
jgi:hypothetical protein